MDTLDTKIIPRRSRCVGFFGRSKQVQPKFTSAALQHEVTLSMLQRRRYHRMRNRQEQSAGMGYSSTQGDRVIWANVWDRKGPQ